MSSAELLAHVAERLMEFEVEQRTGAEYGERTADRNNGRNGYRDRLWETRIGSADLRIPKLRLSSYLPDERVNAFPARPLEGDWPYLRIDATYVRCVKSAASYRLP